MLARFETAAAEVPELEVHREAVLAAYDRAAAAEWPELQRIHGDLHLGQVLWSDARGWVVIDFEGEPLRTMAERTRPDVALRDVAGMLRSFDYVAGSLSQEDGADADRAGTWAADGRRAFADGYTARAGVDLARRRDVLDAFELDKAVYETLYERRNRPSWIGIPLAAVERLVGGAGAEANG
jgi:predicted trehalose synthase